MIKEYIQRKVRDTVSRAVSDLGHDVYRDLSYQVQLYKRKIVKDLVSIAILLVSIVFLALAVIFSMIEYLGLSKTLSFGIIGIVLLLIGIILKIRE